VTLLTLAQSALEKKFAWTSKAKVKKSRVLAPAAKAGL
jgi:hypothetical protein